MVKEHSARVQRYQQSENSESVSDNVPTNRSKCQKSKNTVVKEASWQCGLGGCNALQDIDLVQ